MFNIPIQNKKVAYRDNKGEHPSGKNSSQSNRNLNALNNLSPDLSLLLSLAMKDRKSDNIMPILQSIEPFLEPNDRNAVGSFLGMSDQLKRLNYYNNTHSMNTGYQDLSKSDRQMSLMRQLMKHTKGQSKSMINKMQEAMASQAQMGKMMKQVSNIGNMDKSDPMAMFELMSMFMPKGQMGELKNIQNMMNLFKNMNGNDMSSFMKNFMK